MHFCCISGLCQWCSPSSNVNVDSSAHLLTSLIRKRLTKKRVLPLVNNCNALRQINNELWCCQDDGQILVLDPDMTQKHTLHNRLWGDVHDVIELNDDEVVLAGSGGLFLLSAAGQVKATMQQGLTYLRCMVIDGAVYVHCLSENAMLLLKFTFNGDAWLFHVIMNMQTLGSVQLLQHSSTIDYPDNHCWLCTRQRADVTMAASSSEMFLCIAASATAITVSSTGEITRKIDVQGDLLSEGMAYPRISAADSQGNILLLDDYMGVLQVRDVTGEFHQLKMDCGALMLDDALFSNGALYLVCDDGRSLWLYTAN